MRDLSTRCLPITKRFAYRELQSQPGEELRMRRRLSDWYEGKDVPDDERRKLVIAARQGEKQPDVVLVDAAIDFRRQHRTEEAARYFIQAIDRNPSSWRAHREYAELLRDDGNVGAALKHYEQAAANAPRKGNDRALIFREWGMLLKDAGAPDSVKLAIEKLEEARNHTPNDPFLLHSLAVCYVKKAAYRRAEEILEKLVNSPSAETRIRSYDLLIKCYERTNEALKLGVVKAKRDQDDEAKSAAVRSRRSVRGSSRPLSNGVGKPHAKRR